MRPRYELTIGSFRATDDRPSGGPGALVVDRDIDVPLDVARVRLADRSGVAVGDACTIALGLDDTPQRVFTGTVVEVRPDTAGAGVLAAGVMSALLDLRVASTYSQVTLGSVVRNLAGQAGMVAASVADGPMLPRLVLDVRRSALEQLRDLAARFGLDLFADRDGGVVLQELPSGSGTPGCAALAAGTSVPPGGLRWGAELIAAQARHRPVPWDAVTVGGESPSSTCGSGATAWLTADDDAARGESGSGARSLLLIDPVARTKDLARDLAAGTRRFTARTAAVVEVTVPGRPGPDLGDGVSVSGAPDDLLGGGHVRGLRHRLDARTGFTTRLRVVMPPSASGPEAGL